MIYDNTRQDGQKVSNIPITDLEANSFCITEEESNANQLKL